MNKQLITITTDFGDQFAASQLQAVIASFGFDGKIIENHSVTPFAIFEGAFEIWQLTKFTPGGSVHVGVIDPGVGSTRWGVIIQTKKGWYVGPDNGLFYPAAERDGIVKVWKLEEQSFGEVSNTFHGRDIFIKAGVLLAQGKQPRNFASREVDKETVIKLSFKEGQILHIDDYGDTKIWWPYELKVGTKLILEKDKRKYILPVVRVYSDVEVGQPVALLGSQGTLEIAVNQRSAKDYFKFRVGEILEITEQKL